MNLGIQPNLEVFIRALEHSSLFCSEKKNSFVTATNFYSFNLQMFEISLSVSP
jgi:hypothetical protein